ncbi:hypothetical protein CVS30_07360 [Arthrobacter psychrolactophilus]|uniref:Uncharacterized protein n=1 Tax=Arthrobacter psychrolactophilus TaxID=92442 RepID=A0A2V5IRF9_9MICC|nr:septum formation family protein [Arthrobacter psychrolactophilus]PYI39115.1 hypothetical protein CVS30_07360 [Arthrobacter psychrolactophilus]
MNESNDASDQGAQKKPQNSQAADQEQTPDSEIAASELAEPTLGAAEISGDVAESVDLEAVEAEAARVEHEAELASQGVSVSLGEDAPKDPAATAEDQAKPVAQDAPAEESGAELTESADPIEEAPAEEPSTVEETPIEDRSGEDASQEVTADTSTAETAKGATVATSDTAEASDAAESEEATPAATDEASAEAPIAEPPATTGPGPHTTSEDAHGWRRPETPWQPKAGQWQSPAQLARTEEEAASTNAIPVGELEEKAAIPSAATSAIPAQARAVDPAAQQPAAAAASSTPPNSDTAQSGEAMSASSKKKLFILLGAAVVGLGLIALLIWLIVDLIIGGNDGENVVPVSSASSQAETLAPSNAGTSPAATAEASKTTTANANDGLILAALSPLDWRSGDCLRDFTDQSKSADVVLCSSPHNAQLVGTFYYDDADEFPGVEALKAKALDVCNGVVFTSVAAETKTLLQSTAYPTEATWNDQNDRRVDCMVHDTREGNQLEADLVK